MRASGRGAARPPRRLKMAGLGLDGGGFRPRLPDRHLVDEGAEEVALLGVRVAGEALLHHRGDDRGGAQHRLGAAGINLFVIRLAVLQAGHRTLFELCFGEVLFAERLAGRVHQAGLLPALFLHVPKDLLGGGGGRRALLRLDVGGRDVDHEPFVKVVEHPDRGPRPFHGVGIDGVLTLRPGGLAGEPQGGHADQAGAHEAQGTTLHGISFRDYVGGKVPSQPYPAPDRWGTDPTQQALPAGGDYWIITSNYLLTRILYAAGNWMSRSIYPFG